MNRSIDQIEIIKINEGEEIAMKISIIIPVYNAEKFLEKLLESISKQTYKNYEVILINDGSTDNSLAVINNIAKGNDKIKCITIKNSGPGLARKRGFEEAKGDLLFFIDSDDYIPNDKALEKIVEIYKENKFDILFFDFISKLNKKEKVINAFQNKRLKEKVYNIDYLHKNIIRGALWSKIFIREKMKNEYFCNYNNYEDYYTTYRYLENCDNFYYTKEIMYYANRDNNESLSKIINSEKIGNTVEILKTIYTNTKFKNALSIIIYNYYVSIRKRIDKVMNKEESNDIKKIKELKPYFSLMKLLKMRQKPKRYLIYVYYLMKDMLYRSK